MKGPIIPVTAHRQPAAAASKDRRVDSCSLSVGSCWAQWLGFRTVPISQNPQAVPSAQLSPGLVPTPPDSGGRVDKYSEPFPFLSPSSLPPILIT